jgi:hypothetical protein
MDYTGIILSLSLLSASVGYSRNRISIVLSLSLCYHSLVVCFLFRLYSIDFGFSWFLQ